VDPRLIERLLRDASDTEAEEISCSECFDLLSPGVELELSGSTSAPVLMRLAQHLRHCGVCREEYETLRDFLRSEPEDRP
jgi:aspartyl/asparaginyl-tRNA synthetase